MFPDVLTPDLVVQIVSKPPLAGVLYILHEPGVEWKCTKLPPSIKGNNQERTKHEKELDFQIPRERSGKHGRALHQPFREFHARIQDT